MESIRKPAMGPAMRAVIRLGRVAMPIWKGFRLEDGLDTTKRAMSAMVIVLDM
jgi:hypothetical protein